MLLSKTEKIEEKIVRLLSNGSQETTDLFNIIEKQEPITLQGFYFALRKLIKEEIVVKYKTTLSLNIAWINRLRQMLQNYAVAYDTKISDPAYVLAIQSLEENDKITYTFRSTASLDIFWVHLVINLVSSLDNKEVFFYNMHSWHFLYREKPQNDLFQWFFDSKTKVYFAIKGNYGAEQRLKSMLTNEYTQIATGVKIDDSDRVHTTVAGPFIIKATYEKRLFDEIENIYQKNMSFDEMKIDLLKAIEKFPRCKIVIKRSQTESERYKRKFKKFFHVKN